MDIAIITEACNQILIEIKEIEFDISKLPINCLIIRMPGYGGHELFNHNNKIATLIQDFVEQERKSQVMDLGGSILKKIFAE